jgi:DDE superfamily endonuclease
MLLKGPLEFIKTYVNTLNEMLSEQYPNWTMSKKQRLWMSLTLSCMLLLNCLNWHSFERITLKFISFRSYCWIFHHAKIAWNKLIMLSAHLIIVMYHIKQGVLVIDDTDRKRSKSTKRIAKVHTIKDKSTGGFLRGQNIVFLLLVTDKLTLPVGFLFYQPDPALTAWRQTDKQLRKQKVPKSKRPMEPERDPNYPTKSELALRLIEDFKNNFPLLKIHCILADGLYGYDAFLQGVNQTYVDTQVISQLRCNQLVKKGDEYISLEKYFSQVEKSQLTVSIRGDENKKVYCAAAMLYIKSHHKKRRVVALKYHDEDKFRYIVVTDPNWMMTNIISAYTLRWLVEVFFFDWKGSEGWAKLAKQQGYEGSSRGLILSVLLDHCLLLHPAQKAKIESKLPACTVGSLRAQICIDSIIQFIEGIFETQDPLSELKKLKNQVDNLVQLVPSKKHLNHRKLDIFEQNIINDQKAA